MSVNITFHFASPPIVDLVFVLQPLFPLLALSESFLNRHARAPFHCLLAQHKISCAGCRVSVSLTPTARRMPRPVDGDEGGRMEKLRFISSAVKKPRPVGGVLHSQSLPSICLNSTPTASVPFSCIPFKIDNNSALSSLLPILSIYLSTGALPEGLRQ